MDRRRFLLAAGGAGLGLVVSAPSAVAQIDLWGTLNKTLGTAGQTAPRGAGGLSPEQIVAGLREALRVGTERVVAQVGALDGFLGDPAIHIPLPDQLRKVQDTMRRFGLSSLADDVETRINRAAEAASPKAKELVFKAIEAMTWDDAKAILDGPDDAATQYFRRVAGDDLRAAVKPVVDTTLAEVGALSAYDQLMGRYKALPFVPDVRADLSAHATEGTLDGVFHYLAQEEAAIRAEPAKRTTEILKTVFGG